MVSSNLKKLGMIVQFAGNIANFAQEVTPKLIELSTEVVKLCGETVKFCMKHAGSTVALTSVASSPLWLPVVINTVENLSVRAESLVILENYLETTEQLLLQAKLDGMDGELDPDSIELVQVRSLTALRALDGKGKGRLLRFLAEGDLLQSSETEISLKGADLRSINLQDAWLPDINLQGAYAFDANLVHADLTRAHLQDADFRGANLSGAVLTGALLTDSWDKDAVGAVFIGADLSRVDLTDANLANADFSEANLTRAQIDVEQALKEGAIFCNATMPDGTKYRC